MRVAIYCSSSSDIDDIFKQHAVELANLLVDSGVELVTGGGNSGLMLAVQEAALKRGGVVTGVIPTFMIERGWLCSGLTHVVETTDMQSRKDALANMADAVIALPGGPGTFEELLERISWKTLGLFPKPIIILNTENYYAPLLAMLNSSMEHRFLDSALSVAWVVASTPREALEQLLTAPKWNNLMKRYH